MKRSILVALACALVLPAVARAQPVAPDWQRASNYYLQGWSELNQDPATAEALFRKSIDAYPEFALGYYGLGRACMQQKRYTEALAQYVRAQELFRKLGSERIDAQVGLLRRGYRDSAVSQDARVAASDTRMTPSGPSRTRSSTEVELANQLSVLQQAAQKDSRSTVVNTVPSFLSLATGSAYFRLNQLADAEREYQAAVDSEPKNGEAWNNLAVVYLLSDRPADAERAVKAAEKAGYRVNPNLKSDIKKKKSGG
jgi:tetratricopeptide (TPR) repeat protein